jgi:hypothetical protein
VFPGAGRNPQSQSIVDEGPPPDTAIEVVGGVPGGVPGRQIGGVIGGVIGGSPSSLAPPPPLGCAETAGEFALAATSSKRT